VVNCMKSLLKKVIPNGLKQIIVNNKFLKLFQMNRESLIDMFKYLKYSATIKNAGTQTMAESELIFYYHKIEKGLSLPNPKKKFGYYAVEHLVDILDKYVKLYSWDKTAKVSLNTLKVYIIFNKNHGLDLKGLNERVMQLESTLRTNCETQGGTTYITKQEINSSSIDFKNFAYSRYSIRNFTDENVELDIIKEAVLIAQKTPSVCNRQSSRIYVYSDKKHQSEILKYQNGNRGFGHLANKIVIITSKLDHFITPGERNQSYIDGGMYAMSFIYALHSLGVGTCPLNLAINNQIEKKLKNVAKIDDSEVLIMMIAVGHIPDSLKVATSARRDVNDVLKVY
jgi:nitroreductase